MESTLIKFPDRWGITFQEVDTRVYVRAWPCTYLHTNTHTHTQVNQQKGKAKQHTQSATQLSFAATFGFGFSADMLFLLPTGCNKKKEKEKYVFFFREKRNLCFFVHSVRTSCSLLVKKKKVMKWNKIQKLNTRESIQKVLLISDYTWFRLAWVTIQNNRTYVLVEVQNRSPFFLNLSFGSTNESSSSSSIYLDITELSSLNLWLKPVKWILKLKVNIKNKPFCVELRLTWLPLTSLSCF